MRIYFDGSSWTAYKGVEEEDSYPYKLAKSLGAEYDNFALRGSSNHRLVRNLLLEHDVTQYDLVILDFSDRKRLEFIKPDTGKWKQVIRVQKDYESGANETETIILEENYRKKKWVSAQKYKKDFWTDWYSFVYTNEMGEAHEKIHKITCQNHCDIHGVPLLMTCHRSLSRYEFIEPTVKYDYYLKKHCKLDHPDPEEHSKIASDLEALLYQQNKI